MAGTNTRRRWATRLAGMMLCAGMTCAAGGPHAHAGITLTTDGGTDVGNGLTKWVVSLGTDDFHGINGMDLQFGADLGGTIHQENLAGQPVHFQDQAAVLDLVSAGSRDRDSFWFYDSSNILTIRSEESSNAFHSIFSPIGKTSAFHQRQIAQVVVPTGQGFSFSGVIAHGTMGVAVPVFFHIAADGQVTSDWAHPSLDRSLVLRYVPPAPIEEVDFDRWRSTDAAMSSLFVPDNVRYEVHGGTFDKLDVDGEVVGEGVTAQAVVLRRKGTFNLSNSTIDSITGIGRAVTLRNSAIGSAKLPGGSVLIDSTGDLIESYHGLRIDGGAYGEVIMYGRIELVYDRASTAHVTLKGTSNGSPSLDMRSGHIEEVDLMKQAKLVVRSGQVDEINIALGHRVLIEFTGYDFSIDDIPLSEWLAGSHLLETGISAQVAGYQRNGTPFETLINGWSLPTQVVFRHVPRLAAIPAPDAGVPLGAAVIPAPGAGLGLGLAGLLALGRRRRVGR